jgi:hypothetical protein
MPCAVLPSEFFEIPVTSSETGLTGYFVSPYLGAFRDRVPPDEIQPVIPSGHEEAEHAISPRPEKEQWLKPWTGEDERRLILQLKNGGQELDQG